MSKLFIYSRPDYTVLYGTVQAVGRSAAVISGDVYQNATDKRETCLCRVNYPAEKLEKLRLSEGLKVGAKVSKIKVIDTDPPIINAEASLLRYTGNFEFPENGRDRAASVIIGRCTDQYFEEEYCTYQIKSGESQIDVFDYNWRDIIKGRDVIITAIKTKGRLKAQKVLILDDP